VLSGPGLKKGDTLTGDYLGKLSSEEWFKLRLQDDSLNELLERAEQQLEERRKDQEERFEVKRSKIQQGDDLAPGVLKIVKVYLAVKSRIQSGDKMAGRHGNKGVISRPSCRPRTCRLMSRASRWMWFSTHWAFLQG